MRRSYSLWVSATLVCGLSASALAEDQRQIAEQLLERAFSCPRSIGKLDEGDGPSLTVLHRQRFSGDKLGFRVTSDDRQLQENHDGRAPIETLRRFITSANYADLEQAKITRNGLILVCRLGRKCIALEMKVIKGAGGDGSPMMSNEMTFGFCNEEALQDAGAAFDTLIASTSHY